MPLRIIFFGTAELAVASFEALTAKDKFQVVAAVTQPDKPRGRDLQLQPSPVKAAAMRLGIPVLQPKRAREETFLGELRQSAPDLIVVAAYGQILPQVLLDIPKHGSLNVHTSLLPRHRGAAPIQWAILSGDAETGVTIMKMDAGLDTGPILTMRKTPVLDEDTGQSLHDRLAGMGAELLLETIPGWISGRMTPQPQPEGSTYARKIEKSDGLVNWEEPSIEIWRKIRAFNPWPGAYTYLPSDEKKRLIKLWKAAPVDLPGPAGTILSAGRDGIVVGTGVGSLRVLELQAEGKKRMAAQDYLAGNALEPGQSFT